MVKLVSARECRTYGPRQSRRSAEYINAGLYLFSALLLIVGFAVQLLSTQPRVGLIILLIAFALIIALNLHDLFAHLAGIDFRLSLMAFDRQLALVEFAVPILLAAGTLLSFLGILFLFIQEKRHSFNTEKHAMGMLIAGPVLWVVGSILNSCQIYDRADGHVQLLQHSVQIPFLMGSCLFLVGTILNRRDDEIGRHGVHLLDGRSYWTWMGMWGSLLWLVGGLNNVMKVFKMQQMDGMRLEKLRGGAQERLAHGREGRAPLMGGEEQRRPRKVSPEEGRSGSEGLTSTYKDALVRQAA